MCQHYCVTCGVAWSCQDFGIHIPGSTVEINEPCIFRPANIWLAKGKSLFTVSMQFDTTQVCPKCYAEQRRWYSREFPKHLWDKDNSRCSRCGAEENNGSCHSPKLDKLSFKGMLKKMDDDTKRGRLDPRRIVELQLDEEGMIKNMTPEAREVHYNDLLQKMELFRTRALAARRVMTDLELEELCKVSEEDRAAFEVSKKKRAAERRGVDVTAVRKDKTQKLIADWAARIMKSNPNLSVEQATEKAKKLVAD